MNDMSRPGIDPALREAPYPLQAHLGFEITGWAPDYARVEMPLQDFHANRYGIPHGGLYATLLDTAMGFCACYTGDPDARKLAMTLSLTTNFLAQPKDGLLVAEARRTGGGRKTFFAEGQILDGQGTLVATGSGTFRLRGS